MMTCPHKYMWRQRCSYLGLFISNFISTNENLKICIPHTSGVVTVWCGENLQSKTPSTDWVLSGRLLRHWWRTTHPTPHKVSSRAVSEGFSRPGCDSLTKKNRENNFLRIHRRKTRKSPKIHDRKKWLESDRNYFLCFHLLTADWQRILPGLCIKSNSSATRHSGDKDNKTHLVNSKTHNY